MRVSKTLAAGGLLVYLGSETLQDVQHPGETDRDRTNVYLTDTGYVSYTPETILQEVAYRHPVPERSGVTQRPISDTGGVAGTGDGSLDGCKPVVYCINVHAVEATAHDRC
jgi:hypothetical protein